MNWQHAPKNEIIYQLLIFQRLHVNNYCFLIVFIIIIVVMTLKIAIRHWWHFPYVRYNIHSIHRLQSKNRRTRACCFVTRVKLVDSENSALKLLFKIIHTSIIYRPPLIYLYPTHPVGLLYMFSSFFQNLNHDRNLLYKNYSVRSKRCLT